VVGGNEYLGHDGFPMDAAPVHTGLHNVVALGPLYTRVESSFAMTLKISDWIEMELRVQVHFVGIVRGQRIIKLKMDEKYTWNLTWQHKDKVLVFHGICVQHTSKEGRLFAICGDTKGNKKVVISCQGLFY